jgi:hypothetical protein
MEFDDLKAMSDADVAVTAEAIRRLGVDVTPAGAPETMTQEDHDAIRSRMRRLGSEGVNAFLRGRR